MCECVCVTGEGCGVLISGIHGLKNISILSRFRLRSNLFSSLGCILTSNGLTQLEDHAYQRSHCMGSGWSAYIIVDQVRWSSVLWLRGQEAGVQGNPWLKNISLPLPFRVSLPELWMEGRGMFSFRNPWLKMISLCLHGFGINCISIQLALHLIAVITSQPMLGVISLLDCLHATYIYNAGCISLLAC